MTRKLGCGMTLSGGESDLEEMGLDPSETCILRMARLLFKTFSMPGSQAWIDALDTSCTHFGPVKGSVIATGLLDVIRALRRSRKSVFRFSNPSCADCSRVVTQEERHLIKSIALIRQHRFGSASGHLVLVTEGNGSDDLVAAIAGLVRAIDTIQVDHSKSGVLTIREATHNRVH